MSKLLFAAMLLKLLPCHVPGVAEEVRCGRYEVFENRAARSGRKIALNIVVLPATGPKAARDPLVFLAGGGVAPATRYAAFLAGVPEAAAGARHPPRRPARHRRLESARLRVVG
jgi:hypothetical protein